MGSDGLVSLFPSLRRRRHLPCCVIGVQQLVGHAGERFLQVFVVDFLDLRVLVGEAEFASGVQEVEVFGADLRHLAAFVDRLSAAAHAAARTGHDFNKVIEDFLFADCFDQAAGIAEAAYDSDFDGGAGDVDGGFPPAVHAADAVEGVRFRVLAGGKVVAGAKRRFHDAACGAEDDAGAGALTARGVKVVFRQAVNVDVQGAQIVDELSGV